VVWGFFYFIGKNSREFAMLWLVLSSLFFYGWWNPSLLSLIISSIIVNYCIGEVIRKVKKRTAFICMVLGVVFNLGLIGYFKYANFFVDTVNQFIGASYHLDKIILPLAISFFTFQQITYLVDRYHDDIEDHGFLHYCLFVTFFPQLIAGPIVHHKEILTQFTHKLFCKINANNLALGISVFSIGLFKKVILADGISTYSTAMFSSAENGLMLSIEEYWIGALAYSMQLYFDFSGYSDMAIGLALLFGINLPINFNSPYKATSIIEFWTRWHITLSRFLKDYVYIPLGGNRHGANIKYRNLIITMLLGGLWHGAGWTFVIWGGLHGIYLAINHFWRFVVAKFKYDLSSFLVTKRAFSFIITFMAVLVGWVIFRSDSISTASTILLGMCGLVNGEYQGLFSLSRATLCVFILLFIALFLPNTQQIVGYLNRIEDKATKLDNIIVWSPSLAWCIYTAALLSTSILFLSRESEFLYFQF
jgi:alginate O-acetyltransferase complex protein AlgI